MHDRVFEKCNSIAHLKVKQTNKQKSLCNYTFPRFLVLYFCLLQILLKNVSF